MLIIGITGGTGSGKTSIAQKIVLDLCEKDTCLISQDSYYKDTSALTMEERIAINFDHPDSIDFELLYTQLESLKKGMTIEQPVYSFVAHNRTEEKIIVTPKKVLLLEGILILSDPKVRELLDIKIFIDTDTDERLIRRLKRDIQERGRDTNEVLDRYLTTLKPMHQQFIEPTKVHADLIIPNNNYNEVAVTIIKDMIKKRLLSTGKKG